MNRKVLFNPTERDRLKNMHFNHQFLSKIIGINIWKSFEIYMTIEMNIGPNYLTENGNAMRQLNVVKNQNF